MPDTQYADFLSAAGALSQLVVLSILLERGLAFVFEHDWFRLAFTREVQDPAFPNDPARTIRETRLPGLRGTLALLASFAICEAYKFDVLAAVFRKPVDQLGVIITSVVAAGGSAGAIAVFQGFLSFNRDAREALIAAKKAEAQAQLDVAKAQAEARKAIADADKAIAEARRAGAEAQRSAAEAQRLDADTLRLEAQSRADLANRTAEA